MKCNQRHQMMLTLKCKTLKNKTWGKLNKLNGNTSRKQSLLKSSTTDTEGSTSEVYTSHNRCVKYIYTKKNPKYIKRLCLLYSMRPPWGWPSLVSSHNAPPVNPLNEDVFENAHSDSLSRSSASSRFDWSIWRRPCFYEKRFLQYLTYLTGWH